jgi:hypothetical protein
MDFLITSEGDWLVAGSKEAEASIGYDDPDFDLTAFAVRNLGFIQVTWASPTNVRVRFHPDQVAPGALDSLKSRRDTFGDANIELGWLTRSWQTETFPDAVSAIARVDTLARPYVAAAERYRANQQDLSVLEAANGHPLKLLLQKWRVSFRSFSDSVMPFAMQHGFFSRMMIAGVRKNEPAPIFRYIGEGFSPLWGESFTVSAIGEKIENQPDKAYGAWVSRFYSEVAETARPRFDIVEAIVPKAQRGPWIRYERLLLPWKTPSGEVFVTLASATLATSAPANDVQADQATAEVGKVASSAARRDGTSKYEAKSSKISSDDIRISANLRSPQSEPGNRIL